MVGIHIDTETHTQHFGFARCQAFEDFFGYFVQAGVHRSFCRRNVVGILDEVAQVRIVVVANRCFHGNRLFGDFHDFADFVLRHFHQLGQFGGIRFFTGFLQVLARDTVHFVDGFNHVNRNADGTCLVGDGTGNRLTDPPCGVSRELVAAAVFEFVYRFHQADIAFLNQIKELQAAVGVFFGNGNNQTQVGLNHFLFGG